MRGVYAVADRAVWTDLGSSPHARGLQARGPGAAVELRIIPACAGFTPCGIGPVFEGADHPRMRGVYTTILLIFRCTARIIPACAGFTCTAPSPTGTSRDHPRMRGVYADQERTWSAPSGSSPHARGLHLAILGIPTVLESTTPRFPSLLT